MAIDVEKAANGAVLTLTAKYASLLCVGLITLVSSVGSMYMTRLVSALDANTDAVARVQNRMTMTETALSALNDRVTGQGQWMRRNADDIDDLKKRVYPLTRGVP